MTVQASMQDCLKCVGDNTEPMYHMGKAALRHGGILPIVLTVDHKLVADAKKYLNSSAPPDKEKKDKKSPFVP